MQLIKTIFKRLFEDKISKSNIKDIGALGILQISNQIIPLIIIPFITKRVGIENYGIIAVCLSILYGQKVFMDLGLDLFGVAWIGKYKNLIHRLNSFVWNSIYLKVSIWVISFLILIVVNYFVRMDTKLWALMLIGQTWLLGESLFLKYYYQTTDKIHFITIFSLTSKVIMLVSLIVLFKNSNSINNYLIAMSLGSIVSGLLGLLFLQYRRILKFELPNFKILKYIFLKNRELLAGRIIVYGYSHFLTFIVQFLMGYKYNGYFLICQKLVGGASSLLTPFSEVFFPSLSKEASSIEPNAFFKSFYQNLKILLILSSIPIVVLILFNNFILELFIREEFIKEVNYLFMVLSFTIAFNQVGLLFTQLMTIIGEYNFYLKNVSITMILTITSAYLLGSNFGIIGISYGIILGQIVHSWIYYNKYTKLKA